MDEKALTYQEFMCLAKQNYCEGGMYYFECWEKYQFDDYVKMFGEITTNDALKMFRLELSVQNKRCGY